jgi:hypothetical protein
MRFGGACSKFFSAHVHGVQHTLLRSGKLELQCEARDQLQPRCGWAAHTYATRGEIRGLVPDLPNASVYLLEGRRCSNNPSPTVKDVCHVCLAHDAQNRPKATGSAFTQGDTLLCAVGRF